MRSEDAPPSHYFDARFGYSASPAQSEQLAATFTERAPQLDPEETCAHLMQANVVAVEGRLEEATAAAERAVTMRPNDALCWLARARILVSAERAADGCLPLAFPDVERPSCRAGSIAATGIGHMVA